MAKFDNKFKLMLIKALATAAGCQQNFAAVRRNAVASKVAEAKRRAHGVATFIVWRTQLKRIRANPDDSRTNEKSQ